MDWQSKCFLALKMYILPSVIYCKNQSLPRLVAGIQNDSENKSYCCYVELRIDFNEVAFIHDSYVDEHCGERCYL